VKYVSPQVSPEAGSVAGLSFKAEKPVPLALAVTFSFQVDLVKQVGKLPSKAVWVPPNKEEM